MKNIILGSLLLASTTSAFAQLKDITMSGDLRGDSLPDQGIERLQGRVRVGFVIDAAGVVEIVGLVSSGGSFNNDWATITSDKGAHDPVNLAFRNIYLRKVVGPVTLEAGALNAEPTVGAAGLAPSGWVDGARIKINTKIGDFKVVAGSLGDFKQADAFERKFNANFVELEFDHTFFEKLVTQTAIEQYNNEYYLRENLKLDLTLFGTKLFKLFADVLYDTQRNAFNYELGTEFDLLKNIVDKYDNRLNVKLYFSNIDSLIPNRSQTITAFYTYGPRGTAQIGGNIDKKGILSWYVRGSSNFKDNSRVDVGLTLKIPVKVKQ